MRFLVVFTIFVVFLGNIIVWKIINNKLTTIGNTIESRMGTEVNGIKKSNFWALQSSLVDTIATAQKSVVSITISKDIKFYVEDPSQMNGP